MRSSTGKKLRLRFVKLSSVLCLTAVAAALSAAADAAHASFTASANPALARFNESITFYASFDGHATADLSIGDGTPTKSPPKLEFTAGILGQALQPRGEGHALYYDAKDNIDLLHSGSLIVWVAPTDAWTDADDPLELTFSYIRNQGKALLLTRLPTIDEAQALVTVYGARPGDLKTRAVVKNKDTLHWKTGEFHLLVVNWTPGKVQLSVDGSVFESPLSLPPKNTPTDDKRAYIGIAANSTERAPYAVDELMILNRPLANEEVRGLYKTMARPK